MNKFIEIDIYKRYGINIQQCSTDDLLLIEEIDVRDVTMDHSYEDTWDFSLFPNLKKLDCSYNPISKLDVSKNINLEYLRWEGVRGNFKEDPSLQNNTKLQTIIGGQDGLIELDLSANTELTDIRISLDSTCRWIDLSTTKKLKRITLEGVNIPFVDLTQCDKLEYVDINYMNLYRNKGGVFGPGYPRPVIFVNNNFNEEIINKNTRSYEYYTYKLVRVSSGSHNEKVLNILKTPSYKNRILKLGPDNYDFGREVAIFHYHILDLLNKKIDID